MTNRIAIGIDFDDTLVPTRQALIALLNSTHGTTIGLGRLHRLFHVQPLEPDATAIPRLFHAA